MAGTVTLKSAPQNRDKAPVEGSAGLSKGGPQKYAEADEEIVDYQYYQLPGTKKWFRGPPLPAGNRDRPVAFLGAASCFGRFVLQPYANMVGRRLGVPTLNLGYGGARAPFYSSDPALMEVINRSACVVIELFSARGTTCSRIEARQNHSAMLRWAGSNGEFVFSDRFFKEAQVKLSAEEFGKLVEEIRETYVADMTTLLRAIRVPKILFWLSQRKPEGRAADLGGPRSFPHFVNKACLERLKPLADGFVSVVSAAGVPSRLISRYTGEPVEIFPWKQEGARHLNDYYPSPEMHEQAAVELCPAIQPYVTSKQADHVPTAGRRDFLMVTGCPRSGTSALHRLLNTHPLIALGLERFNRRIVKGTLSSADFSRERFFQIKEGDTWYRDLSQFAGVYDELRSKFADAAVVGDKYPRGYLHYDRLAAALPGCRFIFILRDVFDVARSYEARRILKTNWPVERDARAAVRDWNEGIKATLAARHKHAIFVVSYEDMFKRQGSLAPLGKFLELDLSQLERSRAEAAKAHRNRKSASAESVRPELSPEDREYIQQAADWAGYKELLGEASTHGDAPNAGS